MSEYKAAHLDEIDEVTDGQHLATYRGAAANGGGS